MDLDLTLFIQLGIFCALLVGLNSLLLKPVLRLFEQRQEQIVGARREAERLGRLTDDDASIYEARIREARKEAQKAREALRTAGRESERSLLAEARADVAAQLNSARTAVAAAEEKTHGVLATETEVLARAMVAQVLGRRVA